ncbi:arsenate reductase (glutaredoxin) [Flagellimonas meridianipacifica]|uniref:Arsenate reductase n=1 Tax=Flagellimonas meridianipacifica TaxID=1080225 RepID=A0A2T0MCC0_9FLAO|nr:arsenate reductase (glutaredoxin) [Allomuricauda pacifica]PRX55148.1 arsenate reductase [Allomuricauda pacifica]
MIKIYHNPRCRKSREGLAFLEAGGHDFEEIRYLDNPVSKEELVSVIKKLGIPPQQLVRTSESIWKENYKGKSLTDDEVINAMVQHPKLIERPIVINNDKAVVARPAEKIKEIL